LFVYFSQGLLLSKYSYVFIGIIEGKFRFFSLFLDEIQCQNRRHIVGSVYMNKKALIAIFIIGFLYIPCICDEDATAPKIYPSNQPFARGQVVVKYKKAQKKISIAGKGGAYILGEGAEVRTTVRKLFKHAKSEPSNAGVSIASASKAEDAVDEPGVYLLSLQGRDDIKNVVEELKKNPDVEYAEPNYIYSAFIMPNDPSYNLQWGPQKIFASSAWDVTEGSSNVVIAVIDTGVDYNHQDLSANIWCNTKEIPGNGIDDDNNGYIDDIRGWDFVRVPAAWVGPGEDPGPPDNDPMDRFGHGTHVAGIAAGMSNNGLGIAGLAWGCKIMPLRAGYLCMDGGGYLELSDIAEALHYAADNGANVVNMSFGCPYSSALLNEAVNYAHSKGCVLVAAAGNVDSYDAGKPFYPAAYDNVIAVSAVDSEDKICVWNLFAFSNFGSFVDICAPGTSILSTLPNNRYGYESGTSMAAPFVAGLSALLKSKHLDWIPEQVEARLKQSSDNIYSVNTQPFLQGKLGAGRVNARRALGNLNMAITYPRPGNIVSGTVVVKGSADIEYFSDYTLEYSSSSTPDAWKPIVFSSPKPVEDGLIAIWRQYEQNGKYNLKLTVNNTSGESYSVISGANFGINGEVRLSGKPKCGPSPFDPAKGQFLFYYELLSASGVDIYVYDIIGTLVWQKKLAYDAGTLGRGGSAGINRVYWDGENNFGESLGNGAYIYMIIAKDGGDRKIIGRGKFAVVRS
jgi:subtilisin family serine protease